MKYTPFNLISAIFLMFFATSSAFALETICTAPDCAAHKVASTDGVIINAYDWGASNTSRPAIMFIHGFPHDGLHWINQINSSLRTKYRLITIDWRGHGLSGKPDASGYTQQKLADDIRSVLSALKINNVVLVGSSLGGHPLNSYLNVYGANNKNFKIKGVVYVSALADANSFSFVTGAANQILGRMLSPESDTPDGFAAVTKEWVELSTLAPLPAGLKDFYFAQDLLTPKASRESMVIGMLFTPGNFNLTVQEPKVKTLIIWGANDAVVDVAGGHYYDTNIPDSQLVIMPNTGHLPMIEKPADFNQLIDNFADKVK